MEKYLKAWREVLIVLLITALAFIIGRGYESNLVENLAVENQNLLLLKQRTEQLISQNSNPDTQQLFKNMGYNITVTQAQVIPPTD